MQENLKQLKRAKTLNIIAICFLLVLFTASVFLAVIAPVFTSKVASADWVPSGDSNTQYVFSSFLEDYVGDLGLWYNLSVDCTSGSPYYDNFNNAVAWKGNATLYTANSNWDCRVGFLGYVYGYFIDYKISPHFNPTNPSTYSKFVSPLALYERINKSDGTVIHREVGLAEFSPYITTPSVNPYVFFTTRYLDLLGASADMRVVANYTLKNEGNYTLPVDSYKKVGSYVRFPSIARQVGTGKSANYNYQFQGYVQSITDLDSSYTRTWVGDLPVGLTNDSVIQIQTLLSQVMSFGYKTNVMNTSESSYQSGYNNGYQEGLGDKDTIRKEGYNQGYQAGQENFEGQLAAQETIRQEGYNQGYQEGKVAGREVGYQEGVADQGDYTFMGLIGAVFDAPIQAFKGLLSFEVLGVDMTAFVSSLFGLAVILVIIKLILGGK